MKRKGKTGTLKLVGLIAAILLWGVITLSCISEDTAYRLGHDIGSSLNYEGETPNLNNE